MDQFALEHYLLNKIWGEAYFKADNLRPSRFIRLIITTDYIHLCIWFQSLLLVVLNNNCLLHFLKVNNKPSYFTNKQEDCISLSALLLKLMILLNLHNFNLRKPILSMDHYLPSRLKVWKDKMILHEKE